MEADLSCTVPQISAARQAAREPVRQRHVSLPHLFLSPTYINLEVIAALPLHRLCDLSTLPFLQP
jgi:hypothetical protein